jgi:hypothetical protein
MDTRLKLSFYGYGTVFFCFIRHLRTAEGSEGLRSNVAIFPFSSVRHYELRSNVAIFPLLTA